MNARMLNTGCLFRDDYANLTSEDYAANKSFAEDLTEGKFSFPILHAIRNVKFLLVLLIMKGLWS
jgi:geranylgeranyl diphosphate synthase type 3